MDAMERVPGAAVHWRALDRGFWAARRHDRHLGTVQRGRRFIACDAESRTLGVFRTFDEAQRAVIGGRPGRPAPDRTPGPVPVAALLACALGAALAALYPLLGV